MQTALTIIQIIASLLVILFVILQSKGAGLSSTFGGEGMFYRSKRGVEKILFRATIATAAILGISSLLLIVFGVKQ